MSRLLIDMPSGEYWASDSVQPDVRSVVDVLYHVYGKPAYFRGTVRCRQNTEHDLSFAQRRSTLPPLLSIATHRAPILLV